MNRKDAYRVVMTLTLVIGNGFHPDNKMSDYINQDGKPSFKDTECAKWDPLLAEAHEALGEDVYLVGMAFMELNDECDLYNNEKHYELPE